MKKFNLSKGILTALLTLVLCVTCFGFVSARAEDEEEEAEPTKTTAVDATYDADTDEVKAGSNAYVYVVKAASGNKIKVGTPATGQMESNKISIADLGIKAFNKDVYLYVCDKEVELDETVAANLTIKAQEAKKITVKINYTQADKADSTTVLSIEAIDAKKKDIADPVALWCEEIDGTYAASSTFKGSNLKALLDEDGGIIYVKMKGVTGASGTAQFGSKPIKVKIAKPANAPKVKVDFLKGTVALKNGFDYSVVTAEDGTPSTWTTIMPFNKIGSVKGDAKFKSSTEFEPAAKATSKTKASFTKEKVVSVPVEKLLGENAKIYLYVRKSATAKKPASKYNDEAIVIEKPADAPDFATVTGETDEKKKTTTFVSALSDCEYLIVTDPSADLSAAKWAKLSDKGITLKKTTTKLSKTKSLTLKEGSIVLVRIAGVKNEKLPSKPVVTIIKKTAGEDGAVTYTWEKKTE